MFFAFFGRNLAALNRGSSLNQQSAARDSFSPRTGVSQAPVEGRHEIEQCIEAARRISATLRSLMNYARPIPLILKRNLHRLVSEKLAFLEHQPMLHGRILENRVPTDLPIIRVDANQLLQVLMNLLLNAAQATPEGGRITVFAERIPLLRPWRSALSTPAA